MQNQIRKEIWSKYLDGEALSQSELDGFLVVTVIEVDLFWPLVPSVG